MRVKKLKETQVALQQLDKNMSSLRCWLWQVESQLSRPLTYSVCHQQEIQRRLTEQQELQRDIEQHAEGVGSVLGLCDVLLRDEDAVGAPEPESDTLQEASRSLDLRWRTICDTALDRKQRIEETWRLWSEFLSEYSQFQDWLEAAERTAANPRSADVLFSVAKEELKTFERLQSQVHEQLAQLELISSLYRRLARENRADRANQLQTALREGGRRWDALLRRVAAVLRRLKHFTGQREEFEGTRARMLAWLTELDLQLTDVEHYSESDVHHKIQQLNSFQKEITLNTERMDGLIVFGEALIQRSSAQDAALIEDELEELHSYCQEVFSRLVRFHQRLSRPPAMEEEPKGSELTFSLESSLELIGRPWLGRGLSGSLPATPTHLLASPLERAGDPDSLQLEWDHTGDVGGSSSDEEGGAYFSAMSASSRSSLRWRAAEEAPAHTSTPLRPSCLRHMEDIKRVSLILDDRDPPEELGLTRLQSSDKQPGVIERWEVQRAQSSRGPPSTSHLEDVSSWLQRVIPELERPLQDEPAASIKDMEARATELKEMERAFSHYKSVMLSVNLQLQDVPGLQERLAEANKAWSRACTGLERRDAALRRALLRCQEFHDALHSLLLWLDQSESRCDAAHPEPRRRAGELTALRAELRARRAQQVELRALWTQLQREGGDEAREQLQAAGSKLQQLLRRVEAELSALQQRRDCGRGPSFFSRVLRAAVPLQLLLLLLFLLACLLPHFESDFSCAAANNYARSFYPALHYTNGPPPT